MLVGQTDRFEVKFVFSPILNQASRTGGLVFSLHNDLHSPPHSPFIPILIVILILKTEQGGKEQGGKNCELRISSCEFIIAPQPASSFSESKSE
jgi:hypothetical protein